MRRTGIIGLSILLIVLMVSSASALGPFGGAKKDDDKKPDVDALTKRSATALNNVRAATISFAEGLVLVQQAVGKKAEAEKLQQSIANAKEKKGDKNAIKALVGEVNNATASLNKVELASQLSKEDAQKYLGNSVLKLGVGVVLDGIAAKNATDLLKDAQAALKQVSWAAAGRVKEVIDVAQFVTQEIPPQANNIQGYMNKLVDYAKTNGIPTPSQESFKKQADALLES